MSRLGKQRTIQAMRKPDRKFANFATLIVSGMLKNNKYLQEGN